MANEIDWDKVLQDNVAYPDVMTINTQNGPLSLGQLRQVVSQRFAQEQQKLAQAQQEVVAMYQQTQEMAARNQNPNATPPPVDLSDFKKDAYLGPLVSDYERKIGELAEVKAQMAAIQKQNYDMAAEYIEDRIDRDYRSLGTEDYKREEILRYAMENNIKNSRGLPDLKKAFEKLDEPKRIERLQAEAMKKGEQEGIQKSAMRSIAPRAPRVAPKAPAETENNRFSGANKYANTVKGRIGSAIQRAGRDPEIMRNIQ